jgi:phosphodiesterase/alkaline phosphatase D-like protein
MGLHGTAIQTTQNVTMVFTMFSRRTFARLAGAASLIPAATLAQPATPLSRIAFGSCAKQTLPQPIWDPILTYRPDLFIFAGDNVYGDFQSPDAADLKRPTTKPGSSRDMQSCEIPYRISPSGTITTTA